MPNPHAHELNWGTGQECTVEPLSHQRNKLVPLSFALSDVIVGSEDESSPHSNDTLLYLEAGVDCVWPKPLPVLTMGLMVPLLCRYNRDNVDVDGWRIVRA